MNNRLRDTITLYDELNGFIQGKFGGNVNHGSKAVPVCRGAVS